MPIRKTRLTSTIAIVAGFALCGVSFGSDEATIILAPKVKNEAAEYWLYVDGYLVDHRARGNEAPLLQVTVAPGEHKIDVLRFLATTPESTNFPFQIGTEKFSLRRGMNVTAKPDISADYGGWSVPLTGDPVGETKEQWIVRISQMQVERINEYKASGVYLALRSARHIQPTELKTVFVNLPAEVGGRRELDSKQIRILVAWLDRRLFYWFPNTCELSDGSALPDRVFIAPCEEILQGSILQRYEKLKAKMLEARAEVSALNEIAAALEGMGQ